jgi:signal transduction histidine kinase/ActR/RegA family two-component response regulator
VSLVLFASISVFLLMATVVGILVYQFNRFQNLVYRKKPFTSKEISLFLLSSFIFTVLLTHLSLYRTSKDLESNLGVVAESLKQFRHYRLDKESLPNDINYLKIIEIQKEWLKASKTTFDDVYTLKLDDKNQKYFIADSETDYNHNGIYDDDREQRTAIGEVYDKIIPELELAFEEKKFVFTNNIYSDKWGTWVSAFAPVYDIDGSFDAIVGVDIVAEKLAGQLILNNLILAFCLISTFVAHLLYRTNKLSNEYLQYNLEQNMKLTEKNLQEQKSFLAVMSHEIRTPLNSIIGAINLVDAEKLSHSDAENLKIAKQSSHILADIIGDILDYSKIESGKIALDKVEIKLVNVISDIENLFKVQMRNKGLDFKVEVDPKLSNSYFGVDETRLRQILINFISNAYKFTAKGKIHIFVKPLKTEQFQTLLEFRIADTGIGMSLDNEKRLFQSFQQADSTITRKFGGTGLGLVICKNLIELMGGRIVYNTKVGAGTTFVFTLLFENIAKVESLTVINKVHQHFQFAKYSELKILVVDDVQINQIILSKTLKKIGFSADIASNGQEAIEKHQSENYDIIFMDCQMPVLDGIQATRDIRYNEKVLNTFKPVSIIALTANASVEDKTTCLTAGMNQFVAKPFSYEQIEKVLQIVIEQTEKDLEKVA